LTSPDEDFMRAALLEAEAALRALGDDDRAASAQVMAVDALAHAGRIEEALRRRSGIPCKEAAR